MSEKAHTTDPHMYNVACLSPIRGERLGAMITSIATRVQVGGNIIQKNRRRMLTMDEANLMHQAADELNEASQKEVVIARHDTYGPVVEFPQATDETVLQFTEAFGAYFGMLYRKYDGGTVEIHDF